MVVFGARLFLNGVNHLLKNSNMKKKTLSIISGMLFMMVFGIIDNAGIILGMGINPFITPESDPMLSAMWGNTLSDMMGAIAGVFVLYMFRKMFKTEPSDNLYGEIIGITVGCLIPIIVYVMVV